VAKFYETLNEDLIAFIRRQKVFFTSTAPTGGRINLSPKGLDSLRVLDPRTVAWLDFTGSGNETAAHLKENGRITLMFCAFEGEPLILRLYGKGTVIPPRHPEWGRLRALFPPLSGIRQIMQLDIESLQTSCGFGVPLLDYAGDRDMLTQWAMKKGEAGLRQYRQEKNRTSIDGLPTGLMEDSS
jgi:Pyridoxamine 5'-phosphate oxidase